LQIARLRLALNKQHTLMLQHIPKLAGEGFVFLSDLYDCPEPELEALFVKVEIKPPHAKLVRAALKAPQPPYNDELAGFVERPELPPDDFLVACGLGKYAEQLTSEGYCMTRYLLDARKPELADACASMKPVEQRRFLCATERLQLEAERRAKVETQEKVAPSPHPCNLFA
jgi:hypothetical protein